MAVAMKLLLVLVGYPVIKWVPSEKMMASNQEYFCFVCALVVKTGVW